MYQVFLVAVFAADCDVAELQQSRKLSRYVIPYGTDKVSHGQYTYGYCGIGEEEG